MNIIVKKSGWDHECEDNYRDAKSKKTKSSISNEMFEIEKDMMNVETLIHKDGDSINIYDHHLDDGTLKKNNKVVGIWNGSKVLSKKDNTNLYLNLKQIQKVNLKVVKMNMYKIVVFLCRGSEGGKGAKKLAKGEEG